MTELTEGEFDRVRAFVYERIGVSFEAAKLPYVAKRVATRMQATDSRDFDSYFRRLRTSLGEGSELQQLVNLLTVNETYFFREEYQLACLVRSILGEVVAARPHRKRVRLLSLPCSTGEEPFSLALYLLERWPLVDRYDVEIVGADIDTRVLADARRGVYGARSLQNLGPEVVARYFRRLPDGQHQLCEEILGSVELTHVNLNDPRSVAPLGRFDVVFCRNLLIYFDDVSRRRAVETLYEVLEPGGFVCLGHSESMSRITSIFEARRFADAIVYQRPLAGRDGEIP